MEGPLPEALQNTGLFQDQWPEGTSSTQKGGLNRDPGEHLGQENKSGTHDNPHAGVGTA